MFLISLRDRERRVSSMPPLRRVTEKDRERSRNRLREGDRETEL